MEENSQLPSAEEQKEPQNTENLDQTVTPTDQEVTTDVQNKEEAVVETKSDQDSKSVHKETEMNPVSDSSGKDDLVVDKTSLKEEKNEVQQQSTDVKTKEVSDEKEVNYSTLNIGELLVAFKEVTTSDQWLRNHSKIQNINRHFEEKFHADVESTKKAFLEGGGNEIDFFYKPEYKKQFDQLGYEYRKKRRTHFKEQEAAQKVNFERKKAIIEEIKSLIGADENINTIYKNFRTLQESWYSTGPVSRAENQNLWETFKHHVERFYDFLHLNRELRELDFKHNYEEKLKIIERAEALKELPDVMRASRDLNTLHQLWKNDLGPVAKEHREALWKRFQEATKIIQVRRQDYQKDIVGAMKKKP